MNNLIVKKKISICISKRGYSIIKSKFDPSIIDECKSDLTVKPYINQEYGANNTSFSIYLESIKKLYLPKYYGIQKFGEPDEIKLNNGDCIDLEFKGTLRDKQVPVIEKFLNSCEEGSLLYKSKGGIISVGCGFGKTICALYILTKLKKKTLIVVHKEFLMNQWIERIEEFIPDARVGKIQGSTINVENKDIVLAMLQSISMKDYDTDIFSTFGFTIVDECHHIAAEVFSKALPKINSFYSLGLSATPNRSDGMSKVFNLYLGPMIYKSNNADGKSVMVNIINYHDTNKDYCKEELIYGKPCIPKMINNITNNENRNKLIVFLAKKLVDDNRQVLILSDRRNHLSYLYGLINKFTTVGYYIGGMKQKDLNMSEKANVILGTFTMSSEGLDIPTLDAAIFTTPKSNIEQSIGRITRKAHNTLPIAFDIVDCFSIFTNQLKKREKIYRKLKYTLNYGELYINDKLSEGKLELMLDNIKEKKSMSKTKSTCLIEL